MMKFNFFFILLVMTNFAYSQNKLISRGKIIFEKTSNVRSQIENYVRLTQDQTGIDAKLKEFDQKFKSIQVTYFNLMFDSGKGFYKQLEKQPDTHQTFIKGFRIPGDDNEVYTDISKNIRISQKHTFNYVFNIEDTILSNIKWRIIPEKRMIAGYNCQRANGLLNDSIYIVAFFTTEINCSLGPDDIIGLPGMILGCSIPNYHISYFAKSIEELPNNYSVEKKFSDSSAQEIELPDYKQSIKELAEAMPNKDGALYLIQFLFL